MSITNIGLPAPDNRFGAFLFVSADESGNNNHEVRVPMPGQPGENAPPGIAAPPGGRIGKEVIVMETVMKPHIELNEFIPPFELVSVKGTRINVWDYKQKKNLLVAFLHNLDCIACRDRVLSFALRYPEYKDLNTEILLVVREEPRGELLKLTQDLPFPVLVDLDGTVARNYEELGPEGNPRPGVFIADRFGSLQAAYVRELESDLPGDDEIIPTLSLIESECPECGV